MKHLITCLALGIACAAGAQTGLVEFPYNPDADNDDIIGVNDLLELLSLFGSEFSEESLYINDSNTTAIYHIDGSWNYGLCEAKCRELPSGKWRMIDYDTWAEFYLEVEQMCIVGSNRAWLRESPVDPPANSSNFLPAVFGDYDDKGRLTFSTNTDVMTCVCETHQRPKIEYTFVNGYHEENTNYVEDQIQPQIDALVQDGWYPLGGINGTSFFSQAFWRWAE